LRRTSAATDVSSVRTVSRARRTIASVVVVASLLAASAWFKNATCGCGSTGLPWQMIAVVATVVAAVSIAAYAVAGAVARRRPPPSRAPPPVRHRR
jgi:hypothetical protein